MPPQRSRPHRITFDVSVDQYQWLSQARIQDRLTTAERIRALLELCREDEDIAARVAVKASDLAQEEAGT